jgi:hypothetical protein
MKNTPADSGIHALVRMIAEKAPTTTIGELLADPSFGPRFRALPIGQLLGAAPPAPPVAPTRPQATKQTASGPRTSTASIDVRTPAGREVYDTSVLAAIAAHREPASATDVRAKAGGTDLQFRAAVERLIAEKKVRRTGKARGTRYSAA